MKSVTPRSALGRRVAAAAVLGLAVATLSVGVAGPAQGGPAVDLQGTVKSASGTALVGIHIHVEDPTTGTDLAGAVTTDASGHYEFTTLDYTGPVTVYAHDINPFTVSTTSYYLPRFYGGTRYFKSAGQVTLAPDVAKTADLSLPAAGIIAGSVTAGPDGHALSTWGTELANADDVTDTDLNGYENADSDATHFRYAVEPGTYRVAGSGRDTPPTGTIYYVENWWRDADGMTTATPISVVSGQVVSGIDIRLTDALTARQAPSIVGVPAIGRTLTATPGSWSRNAGTEFSYTWMRGAVVVGTGATYIPAPTDFGQRLTVLVRALNGDNAGQAVSAQSDIVRWPADARGRAKALGAHQAVFSVKIVSAKQSPVRGKVVVLRGTKVVHKAVKLVKGKAVIVVKHQPKGKQAFTVVYKGNSLLAKAMKDFTVRVR